MAEQHGHCLFHGKLLPGLLSTHGVKRTPHGGVAILAPRELGRDFLPSDDVSGLFSKLHQSKRVHATWIQVSKTLKLLLFSVYCKTGATQDSSIQDFNDQLLQYIFTIVAQFEDIPVIIAADFQLSPLQYHSASTAVHHHHWNDALTLVDSPGDFRPLTFPPMASSLVQAMGVAALTGF